MNLPEEVFVWYEEDVDGLAVDSREEVGSVRYVRSDIVNESQDELIAALSRAMDKLTELGRDLNLGIK
jgi:hypothetical protein